MKKFNFVHIPKCGGTTMAYILRERCKLLHVDKEYRYPGYENYDVVFGHHSYKVYDHLPMVTWIRNPIDRVVSQFFQFKRRDKIITYPGYRTITPKEERKKTGILEYIERIPNIMLAYLGEDPTVFEFIGHLENYDNDLRKFGRMFEFDVPSTYNRIRVGDNKSEIYDENVSNDKVIEEIKRVNKLDMELYETICNLGVKK
jgi:hypothetical protein